MSQVMSDKISNWEIGKGNHFYQITVYPKDSSKWMGSLYTTTKTIYRRHTSKCGSWSTWKYRKMSTNLWNLFGNGIQNRLPPRTIWCWCWYSALWAFQSICIKNWWNGNWHHLSQRFLEHLQIYDENCKLIIFCEKSKLMLYKHYIKPSMEAWNLSHGVKRWLGYRVQVSNTAQDRTDATQAKETSVYVLVKCQINSIAYSFFFLSTFNWYRLKTLKTMLQT